jgi:hypothetical protein
MPLDAVVLEGGLLAGRGGAGGPVALWDRQGCAVNERLPELTFTPESFAELVDQVADRVAAKVADRLRPPWLTEGEAGEYLRRSPKAIGNARRAGRLTGHPNGRGFVYARAELDRFAVEG